MFHVPFPNRGLAPAGTRAVPLALNKWLGLFCGCMFCGCMLLLGCTSPAPPVQGEQWEPLELSFRSTQTYANPYTELALYARFTNSRGETLLRPGFWDGGDQWNIRFASPDAEETWTYETVCSDSLNKGLHRQRGTIEVQPYTGEQALLKHGFLRMSPGKRNLVHADGTPFLVVGDTPWALPFRATREQAQVYAKDRQQKGFNAALLMSVQPDQDAEGPDSRTEPLGFARGFADLSEGHLNQLNVTYFQYLDSLVAILLAHEIVPVYQPVFQGFGWKGKRVLGRDADPGEYARYCRYLLARYGAQPAMWLISGDNTGLDPCVEPAGEAVEQWDAYAQPTGIHYNPFDDFCPDNQPTFKCFHQNKSHQDKDWLDFQWCQTGHGSEHQLHKVERMYEALPVKAVANGEPTYEGMAGGTAGLGWWQGHEAWSQLMAGGTMGVVYGAASLWQWKLSDDEPGWEPWCSAPISWRKALEAEGSVYVGYVAKALAGFDLTDMEKRSDLAEGAALLAKPGSFYLSYRPEGTAIAIQDMPKGLDIHWFDPQAGQFQEAGVTEAGLQSFSPPTSDPWVLIIGQRSQTTSPQEAVASSMRL